MSWKLANFMSSRLSQAIAAAATTIYIDADDVDLLPTLGASDKAKAVIFDATNREIVNITAWNTNGTLTVERAKEGTSAIDWAAGVKIVHTPTAEILQAVLDATVQAVYRGTATGTNAITVTTTGSVPTPTDGDEVTFEVANTNTAAVTLTYTNGSTTIGPFAVVKQDGTALRAGELRAGWRAKVLYDSTAIGWTLISQASKRYDIERVNAGPLTAGNQLPNGSFDAWINATTFATPASGTETADNVIAEYDGTIGTFSVSRQTFTLGQTDVDGGPKYYLRWDQSSAGAASTYRRLRMRIPQVGKYALELVIASMYAKADVARNVTAKLVQSFGTGGSPSAEVVLATEVWALGTTWSRFDLSTTVTSIAGKTLGSNNDDGLILELSLPVNTSMTADFAMGQFELGDVMTKPHSRLPWGVEFGGTGGSFQSLTEYIAYVNTSVFALNPDLTAIETLAGTSGGLFKTAANTWALRNLAVGTGLSVTNPAGVAGDPTISLGTALTNYNADPLSVAELASITGTFGTAAFVADNLLVHLAGTETVTGDKTFSGTTALSGTVNSTGPHNRTRAVDTDLVTYKNATTTHTAAPRFASAGTLFELTPAPSGTPDATKGFGYDFTNSRWFVDTDFVVSGVFYAALGTSSAPSVAALSDPNTGFYWDNADTLGVITGGLLKWLFRSGGALEANGDYQLRSGPGSASLPGLTCRTDTDTGFYFDAANGLYAATGGAVRWSLTSAAFTLASGVDPILNAATAPSSVYSMGFRGAPLIGNAASNSAITFALVDAGCTAYHNEVTARTWTIPANASVAFPVGTVIIIDNTGNAGAAGTITLNITSDTLRRGDGVAGTGSRTISPSCVAVIRKVSATEWVITGAFT